MLLPVELQKPNKPDKARLVGHADDNLTVEEVAGKVGVPLDRLLTGRIRTATKSPKAKVYKPRRWVLVAI